MRVRARLAVRGSQATWTAYTQVSWLRRCARHVTHEVSAEGWQDSGRIDWLVTSQRIVGRLPASSEMYSIWWSGLAGVDIDLARDRIVLNGVNGWTGMLTGPAVAPIAIAAVAMCHGLEALLVHPPSASCGGEIPRSCPRLDIGGQSIPEGRLSGCQHEGQRHKGLRGDLRAVSLRS